ncbi:MAG TPA: SDR family oxidoreductase [Sporichthyaceae bacterium]|jgi:acyl transferase domain-containing protein/NADP-dependent 3-hydroxy acid dehydrogenase YdfG|nr:SDR family oxidoreductase [Sporichthyaceae bacterium]
MPISPATGQVPVAVVGLAALMPGARDAAEYWRNIVTGRDLITDVPPGHWASDGFYDPDPAAPDKTYSRRGAFLPDIEFDPLAHGLPPATLPALDPAQMLGLLVADELLADLDHGLGGSLDRERVSVILGSSTLSRVGTMDARIQRPVWLEALREQGIDETTAAAVCDRIADRYVPWQEATFPGLLSNVVAGRIANRLDLHGTNCTIDAACASSLAAVAAGVNELSLGLADLVITGGVDATNNPLMYVCFSKTPALSPTGDARPFAEDADGTMLGEGTAMLGLKRLDAAERDGDRIYAVIRGIGSSSDGRGGAIYAPMPQGQVRALRRAYDAAGYGPDTVELVEAHGTATRAGDAAEFESLRQVFGASGRSDTQWCALGTVKSQIGHTKAAAGAAGLVKTVLALHHRMLPPTVKVRQPNSRLGLDRSPFYLNTTARPWTRPAGHGRRASVSSFGFGGANFHVALEEYQGRSHAGQRWFRTAATELVLFGAPSPRELSARFRLLDADSVLSELARDSQRDFDAGSPVRLAVVARDAAELRARLDQAAALIDRGPDTPFGIPGSVHYECGDAEPGRVAFVFPGQGAQYVGMGAEVAMAFPVAQDVWDFAASVELGERGLHEVVFPPAAFSETERAAAEDRLTGTSWAQPALAAHSLSLLAMLTAIGIEPSCLAGHSLGELVALHAAGAMDAETLLRLARYRGELMAQVDGPPGAMLAVAADAGTVTPMLAADQPAVWLANVNAPRQTVVSGTAEAVGALQERLADAGITARRLVVSAAFHSPLMASVARPLRQFLDGLSLAAPEIDVYGNADAKPYDQQPAAVRARLAEHSTSPVRFQDQIEAMYAAGVRTFVEVGAGSTLSGLIDQVLGERAHLAVSLDKRGRDGVTAWHEAVGRLAVRGVPMELSGLSRQWISASPRPARVSDRPRMSVLINGTGYVKPESPAVAPAQPIAPVPPVPVALESAAMSDFREQTNGHHEARPAPSAQWLATVAELQRQTAEAHMHFQRVLGDAHRSFLQMAENTFATFAGPGGGSVSPDVAASGLPALPSMAPAPSVLPPPPAMFSPPSVPARPAATSVPDAPAAAPPPAPAPTPGRTEPVSLGMLLDVVADKTGYPAEMLDGGMDLEADLGVDSIKKVEIFAAVRQRADGMPSADSPQMAQLFQLRTLDQIVQWAGQGADGVPEGGGGRDRSGQGDPGPPGRRADDSTPEQTTVRRLSVRTVRAPACGLPLAGLNHASLVVVDGGSGLAPAVVEHLAAHQIAARATESSDPDGSGVLLLGGMAEPAGAEQAAELSRAAFRTARTMAARLTDRGGVFVTVQDTGGCFGLVDPDPERAGLGGFAALARTAALEWPLAAVKAIDCQRGARDDNTVAAAIVEELLIGGSTLDVGLRADGSRWTVVQEDAVVTPAAPVVTADSVLVATGGARGVTAAALRALAAAHHPRMLLLGRTPLVDEPGSWATATDEPALTRLLATERHGSRPAEVTARARGVLAAREVRGTLAALERAGSTVRYAAVDVTDRVALDRELDRTRRDWGPITGLVHGAGVLADKRIADKTDEQFDRVYGPKVAGWHTLLAATAADPLRLVCVFSSVAARFGNPGQCDYAMANETLNQLACAEARRRSGCRVRSIGWGPWHGGMVTASLAAHFQQRGVPLIPLDAGAGAFVTEIDSADDVVEVLLGAGDGIGAVRPRIAVDVTVTVGTHDYLVDHAPAGVPVLPLAMALEWFAAAARSAYPDRATYLQDVRVLSRIDLPDLVTSGHRFTIDGPGEHDPDLRLTSSARAPHYRARLVAPTEARRWTALPGASAMSAESAYADAVLFHGPKFRTLRGVDNLAADGADSVVVGVREMGWPGAQWWTDPAAVDGALQTAVLWARQTTGDATLPMGVHAVRVHRAGPAPGPLRCLVRAGSVLDGQTRCDVALLDEDGEPRMELLGVSLIRRPDLVAVRGARTAAGG